MHAHQVGRIVVRSDISGIQPIAGAGGFDICCSRCAQVFAHGVVSSVSKEYSLAFMHVTYPCLTAQAGQPVKTPVSKGKFPIPPSLRAPDEDFLRCTSGHWW